MIGQARTGMESVVESPHPVPPEAADLAIYVHWPWCRRICPYCDFNVRSISSAEPQAMGAAICADIARWRERTGPRRVVSVFFGGGTPSTAPIDVLDRILAATDTKFGLPDDAELTLEANPADWPRYADIVAAGINRLSVGVQSLRDTELRFLGRDHDAATARQAVHAALATGAHVSLDAIYALPEQTIETWQQSLRAIIALNAEHLSLYQLTISPDTTFGRRTRRNTLIPMPDDSAADLYESTQEITDAADMHAYEISNHASGPTARSRHNMVYWRSGDWLGLGPGAHGRLTFDGARVATCAERDPRRYMAEAGHTASSGLVEDVLDASQIAAEHLLSGLRMHEGMEMPSEIDKDALAHLQETDFLEICRDRLILTARGRLVADNVAACLLGR